MTKISFRKKVVKSIYFSLMGCMQDSKAKTLVFIASCTRIVDADV